MRTNEAKVAVIGVPIEAGTHQPGPAMGPAMLRTAGLVPSLLSLVAEAADLGDVTPSYIDGAADVFHGGANARNMREVLAWARSLSLRVKSVLDEGRFPLVLGGDHSLSLGSVDGVARHCRETGKRLFVLWLDAHADFNTPATSPSGNVHGMPLAALCGEEGFDPLFPDMEPAGLDPRDVHLFGVRSVDEGERTLLSKRKVDVVDMRRIDESSVVATLRRILDRVRDADGRLHVSLDVDFLDPSVAPGVGTTVPGGATYREAHLVMEMLHESGLVLSLDVVELNPFLDERGRSALAVVELVASLFGRTVVDRA